MPKMPPQRRAALWAIASKMGCTCVGEDEMTWRISAVAVCCSSASARDRSMSAYEGTGLSALGSRGTPHAPQNCWVGLSCWHLKHLMRTPLEPAPAQILRPEGDLS